MKVLTAEKMRQLEEAAVASGLDYRRLMENAGSAAARVIFSSLATTRKYRRTRSSMDFMLLDLTIARAGARAQWKNACFAS